MISPQNAYDATQKGAVIVDVRTDIEYMTEHIPGSLHIPLGELKQSNLPDKDIFFLCRTGGRATKAQQKFGGKVIKGGMRAWKQAGLPSQRNISVWELERQVRLVVGVVVLAGLLLAFVSPWFLAIPGFISLGLIYSALSDSCGMGMCLARLPHNKKR